MNNIQEILAKDSFDEKDLDFLMKNVSILPLSALQRLGLASPTPAVVVKEPVKEVVQKELPKEDKVPVVLDPPAPKAKKPKRGKTARII